MSESILKALMQLFALIGDIHDDTDITGREKDIVRTFLSRHLNNEQLVRYMKLFEEHLILLNSDRITKGSIRDRKRTSLNAMKILSICEKINEELQQKQKIYVLVQLVDYISQGKEITENELDFLSTVSDAFHIPREEYYNIKCFIISTAGDIPDKTKILFVDNKDEIQPLGIKHLHDPNISGRIAFLHIPSTNTYIMKYSGNEDLYLNGQNIRAEQTYVFDNGSSIRGSGINTIYYTEIVSLITESAYEFKVSLSAIGVSFRFRNSENGIHDLDFHEESGRLVGIMGGSGVGKSTSLSILNGTLKPQKGEVLINGFNLYDEAEKESLKGVIGYVPQDDLLIEELTVYQNLYFNAKMCMNNLTEEKIRAAVNRTLIDLDLYEIKDLKVGNPLKKVISGGQRKRVNIALELLREPNILFADEPTSGLSSVDSEMVMNLLKEQSYKGKLVIVNIHQPSSDIFKMFDKIMIIDKGGYQVYYGNPTEAVVYFKRISNHANPDEDQCIRCGNVNTDQLLQIIETKVVDEYGKATRERKISPVEWAEKFRERQKERNKKELTLKHQLPENKYSIPGLLKQSLIFFTRDLLSKLADKQYVLISLVGPPLLAFLLSYFTRHTDGTYKFSENENIPAYLFMCVITSLFFGLMVSSEEIVKDRRILKRESFLNLSWFSYLNSKVMIMFIISAIQTLSFIFIGNQILGIRGMTIGHWLVLFTTSCSANILGLNISSAFNSVVTIYILIPFIIIPQLLFSGVLVRFDRLHLRGNSSKEFVPVIGDLMTARWSFEAMAVNQFKNNNYEKHLFKDNVEESQNIYYSTFLINSHLKKDLWICSNYRDSAGFREIVGESLSRLYYHINELENVSKIESGRWKEALNPDGFNEDTYRKAASYLDTLNKYFMNQFRIAVSRKDLLKDSLLQALGEEGRISLQENYENKRLKTIVLNRESKDCTIETPEKIIRKYEPGYMKATSKYGRAHFYAPVKKIGNYEVATFWFNLLVIWLVTLTLYILLYFKLLQKTVTFFENLRFARSEKRE